MFTKFWARTAESGQNGGSNESRGVGVFFVTNTRWLFGNFPAADSYQIWSRNVNPCPLETYPKGFSKMFTLGVICHQKPQHWKGSNRDRTHTSLPPDDTRQWERHCWNNSYRHHYWQLCWILLPFCCILITTRRNLGKYDFVILNYG